MKILMTGSHGIVGTALMKSLEADGHEVRPLVRYATGYGSKEIEWSPERYSIALSRIEGFDVVVHLAGENIATGRWTDEKKQSIRESRKKGTKLLSEALAGLNSPPRCFLSASATGYYGDRGDEVLTEDSPPGSGFLADVCVDWEKATQDAKEKGIKTVNMRFGIVLNKDGGALAKMLPPFRMGVGGKVGNGKQWMSWIVLEDLVDAVRYTITNEALAGPVNYVTQNPVTNAEFTRTLGKVLSRPTLFPVPAFAARLLFGEMADALLLASQRVDPARLRDVGYEFRYSQLEAALRYALKE